MFPTGGEVAQPAIPAGLILAPILRRIGGLVIDQIIVALPVAVAVVALGFTPSQHLTNRALVLFSIAITCVGLVYETVMIALLGRTVGKLAFGTRVVRSVDGSRPDWYEAGMRALVPLSLSAIPRVGVLLWAFVYSLAFWNPLRQGLHDKAAGTLVVYNTNT